MYQVSSPCSAYRYSCDRGPRQTAFGLVGWDRDCEKTLISARRALNIAQDAVLGFSGRVIVETYKLPPIPLSVSFQRYGRELFTKRFVFAMSPRTASWAIFSVLHFVLDFLATSGHSAYLHTASKSGIQGAYSGFRREVMPEGSLAKAKYHSEGLRCASHPRYDLTPSGLCRQLGP